MPADATDRKPIREPWLSFLREVDEALEEAVEIHCVGGFALSILTEDARSTADVDFIEALPGGAVNQLLEVGGDGSQLAAKYGLHFQAVSVLDPPCDYASRLIDATPPEFHRLGIRLLEPYDLLLTKAQRNFPRDRQDAKILIDRYQLNKETLRNRFEDEVRPYLSVAPEKTIGIMELWLEEFFGGRGE